MSEVSGRAHRRRRRRADAERSRSAVLDAAVRVLAQRPTAGLEEVAAGAGVSRQTVYAHFTNRAALLSAVLDRVTEETLAALDAAALDEGPAAEALLRLVEVSWQVFDRYPAVLAPSAAEDVQGSSQRHEPVLSRLHALIARGQASGEFDGDAAPDWLAAATVALGHAAGGEVGAGRMTAAQGIAALRSSLLRVYGVALPPSGRKDP